MQTARAGHRPVPAYATVQMMNEDSFEGWHYFPSKSYMKYGPAYAVPESEVKALENAIDDYDGDNEIIRSKGFLKIISLLDDDQSALYTVKTIITCPKNQEEFRPKGWTLAAIVEHLKKHGKSTCNNEASYCLRATIGSMVKVRV